MNSFITYSGWVLSVVSILVSIALYLRGRLLKRLELRQVVATTVNFPDNLDAYKVKLNNVDVGTQLTRIQFSLRNRGNAGIEKTDVRTSAQIDFEIENGVLIGGYLGAKVGGASPAKITLAQQGASIILNWDYIDPRDEFPLVMYVTGTYKDARLKGHFKSGVIISNTKTRPIRSAIGIIVLIGLFALYPFLAACISVDLLVEHHFHIGGPSIQNPLLDQTTVSALGAIMTDLGAVSIFFGMTIATKIYPFIRRTILRSTK